jgi:hypothetical protein
VFRLDDFPVSAAAARETDYPGTDKGAYDALIGGWQTMKKWRR